MDWNSCMENGVATLRCIPVVIQNLVNFLLVFAGIVLAFIVVFTGFKFVTSEGDPEKIATARKTLMYGIVGFIIVIGSYLIINVVSKFTGVSQIAPNP